MWGENMGRKTSSNMENYLEAIAVLEKEKGVVRVRDIGHSLGVKNSSVSAALSTLSKDEFVVHEKYGYVELTIEGRELAKDIQMRHNTILKFLTEILDIDLRIAAEDACKMEHSVSPETLEKITKFIEFVKTCPNGERPDWLMSFDHYSKTGKRLQCSVR